MRIANCELKNKEGQLMRFKLFISLIFILGWTYSGQAQEKRSLGDSLYSSKLPSRKLYSSQAEKGRILIGTTRYNSGLYGRGTATLAGGTPTTTTYKPPKNLQPKTSSQPGISLQPGTSLQDGTSSVKTFSSRPWLGQSLYKKVYEKAQPAKPQSNYLPPTEEKDKYSDYYSTIFYKGKRSEPELKDEKVNPFMRR